MTLRQHISLIACVALVGCGTPSTAPSGSTSVASLTDSSSASSAASAVSTKKPNLERRADATRYTVRKAVVPTTGPAIPRVLLSATHTKLCSVQVGDQLPAITLPKLGGQPTDLATLHGKQATVVLFWHPDRWMARTALTDMQRDIASKFVAEQVAVIGIAVRQPRGAVQAALNQAQAAFPQLIDTEGQAFEAVGTAALPRLYVLDPAGKIVWFDIEYSEGTRRELWQTLSVLTR